MLLANLAVLSRILLKPPAGLAQLKAVEDYIQKQLGLRDALKELVTKELAKILAGDVVPHSSKSSSDSKPSAPVSSKSIAASSEDAKLAKKRKLKL